MLTYNDESKTWERVKLANSGRFLGHGGFNIRGDSAENFSPFYYLLSGMLLFPMFEFYFTPSLDI